MTLSSPVPSPVLGGTVASYGWQWQGQAMTLTYETLGHGPRLLLLPAFSTVSTRAELKALAVGLAAEFQVIALDWPGFGESSRLPLDYRPAMYRQGLQDFVEAIAEGPLPVIAAGHSAGYAIALADPSRWSQMVLVAPTWRGPLAVMGARDWVRNGVRELVRLPVLGPALYGLNTQPQFLKLMYRRHVFADAAQLTDAYIQQRHATTQQRHARFAPAAFVTGTLDPLSTEEILARVDAFSGPVLVALGDQSPPASKRGMAAIAALPHVQSLTLPGSLGLAEEYGSVLADRLLPFLRGDQA